MSTPEEVNECLARADARDNKEDGELSSKQKLAYLYTRLTGLTLRGKRFVDRHMEAAAASVIDEVVEILRSSRAGEESTSTVDGLSAADANILLDCIRALRAELKEAKEKLPEDSDIWFTADHLLASMDTGPQNERLRELLARGQWERDCVEKPGSASEHAESCPLHDDSGWRDHLHHAGHCCTCGLSPHLAAK